MTSHLIPAAIFELCYDCAERVYSTRPPNTRYAGLTARLLFGTATHESAGFAHTRQIGYSLTDPRGAWSYWQLEWASILDSITYLRHHDPLARNVALFLELLDHDWFAPLLLSLPALNSVPLHRKLAFLNLIRTWPRLAVVLARLHYLRFPEPIPAPVSDQAAYWKRTYNTVLGRGTADAYLASWHSWAAPAVHNFNSRPSERN